jgi:hypothetical protein
MAQTMLLYVSKYLVDPYHLDYVMLLQATYSLELDPFFQITRLQLTPPQPTHLLLMGQLRDKSQDSHHADPSSNHHTRESEPREFSNAPMEHLFFKNFDSIHLYLASDCYLVSTSLIPGILQEHSKPETRQLLLVGHHSGHDISTLASSIAKTNIHWISITKQNKFWKLVD